MMFQNNEFSTFADGDDCKDCAEYSKEIAALKIENDKLLEIVTEMKQQLKDVKADNKKIMKQKGIACLKHDLINYMKCGHCYEELEQKLKIANSRVRELEK